MNYSHCFDISLHNELQVQQPIVQNLAELIFTQIDHREEASDIIWSHDDDSFITISLQRLRYIVSCLYKKFQEKNIHPGDTVLLVDLKANNVCFVSLLFIALSSYGCRVFLPMWVETTELKEWMKLTNCHVIILPDEEISSLKKHEKEKQAIRELKNMGQKESLIVYDSCRDFQLRTYLYDPIPESFSHTNNELILKIIRQTTLETEATIFTTSGTSGRSKLVVYTQGGFIKNCTAWKTSGMYQSNRLGGRSFIDIFTHTVSVRALWNAIWTGYPICMINSDWIKKTPKRVLPLLIKMKPQVITIGPSSFNLILEFITLFPELKKLVFSELRTIVSTGASYSSQIAKKYKIVTGLNLHNAYGLTETQQVLTTLLAEEPNDQYRFSLGKPLAGVHLGLKKFYGDTYILFVKSPFGYKYIIDLDTQHELPAEEFYNTGDIVRVKDKDHIFFVGRENRDYFKNGFGAKVPITTMKQLYKTLYEQVNHIEYYTSEVYCFSLGIAALIFISDADLPRGTVVNKNTIRKYKKIMHKINQNLYEQLEPFEYENWAITRFLLVNSDLPITQKHTISKYKLEQQFRNQIKMLTQSETTKTGVQDVLRPYQKLIYFLLKMFPLKNNQIRYLFFHYLTQKKLVKSL